MDLTRWAQRFPFAVGADYCPDCREEGETVVLEDDYVRDPDTQGHWRGVPARVCPECDYAERRDQAAEGPE